MRLTRAGLGFALALVTSLFAKDAHLVWRFDGANHAIQVIGSDNDDWHIETSSDLSAWSSQTNFGPLLSGDADQAPWRFLPVQADGPQFYRARCTGGLYDRTLLRSVSLTFTQANWQSLLTSGRTTGSNTVCTFVMDNGATNYGVGARYRGNTSFTGMGAGGAPVKKSINLELDYANSDGRLMGYDTVNFNNAYGDETIIRESLYFNVMRQYTVCPAGALIQLYINGTNWGVYSHAQQQNGDLIREYFPSSDGDRWRAPNMGAMGGGNSALAYLGNTNLATYRSVYELKSESDTNALARLINIIYQFNTAPTNTFPEVAQRVLAVDRWLWFLALENVFADDDSYWNKGADYMLYYEPESGRIHPVEHDGNEAFFAGDASLIPLRGATDVNRPVLRRLLGVLEWRQRYLAHMRTVLEESFNPPVITALINQYSALSLGAITADPKKGYTSMLVYTNDLNALKTFVTNRYKFLTNHADLRPAPPRISEVNGPNPLPTAADSPWITACVQPDTTNGIDSVWLYFRPKSYGVFSAAQMFDDGAHGDGAANDGLFGARTSNFLAGVKVRYYVEARSANPARAASFSPARAEQETYSYRVALTSAPSTQIVINELQADNSSTVIDPQGDFDDWIELRNLGSSPYDLSGCYLSDEPNNPRKWIFPPGTEVPADGYLLVWADENGSASHGLHASFKLSKAGEQLFLADTDAKHNAILDQVTFGPQETDGSYGRSSINADHWQIMQPTPGRPNE